MNRFIFWLVRVHSKLEGGMVCFMYVLRQGSFFAIMCNVRV